MSRVWAVSDIHTDYKENMAWCEELSAKEYLDDALILAGDVTDDLEKLRATLICLVAKWAHVFFVPGNHDLWVRRGEEARYDSLGKLEVVLALCKELGVHTRPHCISGVWIAPIFSWYHSSFDSEPDVPGASPVETVLPLSLHKLVAARDTPSCFLCMPVLWSVKVMVDFHACKWPANLPNGSEALARHFDAMNEPMLSNLDAILDMEADARGGARPALITFSHYLPQQALLPEKRMLFVPNLAKAAGSDFVAGRIAELRPCAHVFGHTHFSWDATLGRTRYVQWPLGYPQERRRRENGGQGWRPLLLYEGEKGLAPKQPAYWSSFYERHGRDPENVEPAPWVVTSDRSRVR